MENSIKDIITELKTKYNLTSSEIERVLDSQWKVLRNNIETRDLKTVNIMHIGKWKPSKWFKENRDRMLYYYIFDENGIRRKYKRDKSWMEELNPSRESREPLNRIEEGDMLNVSSENS